MKQVDNNVEYTQPDSAKVYEQAFAAFSGAPWVNERQYLQSKEVRQAASAIGEKLGVEALITKTDIEKIAAEVNQRCMIAGVQPAEIAKIIARLASNVGASKSSLEEIRGEALKDADDLCSDANGKANETPAQKAERLWQEAKKAEEKAEVESHKLDAWKKPDDLEKENEAEKKYKKALEEYERLKASGASQAELEAAQKRMILAQHVLTEARKESMQGVINNPKAPPEIREQAQQVIASSADVEKRFHEAEVGLERDKSNTTAIIQQTAAVETNADTKAAKMAEISTDLATNRSTGFGSLEAKMASIESAEPTSPKPTTLAHAEVGVLEATSAAPNVQGSGKGANIGVVKT